MFICGDSYLLMERNMLQVRQSFAKSLRVGTKYSRMDQVKFEEDSL